MMWELFLNPPPEPDWKRLAALDSLDKQNCIEAHGWYPDTDEYPGEWRKDDEFGGYMVCSLDGAYEICMREETFDE